MTVERTAIDLAEKLSLFDELWTPKIIGELNGQHVKLAKVKGEFVPHAHEREDELFWVVSGALTIRMEDGDVHLRSGQMYIVPRGVTHQPVAEEETHILLFEPASTEHTGAVASSLTVKDQQWI